MSRAFPPWPALLTCLLPWYRSPQGKVRAHELRTKGKLELEKQLVDLKTELGLLRVAKVTGGAASKLSKMCGDMRLLGVHPCCSHAGPCNVALAAQQRSAEVHRKGAHRNQPDQEGRAAAVLCGQTLHAARSPAQEDAGNSSEAYEEAAECKDAAAEKEGYPVPPSQIRHPGIGGWTRLHKVPRGRSSPDPTSGRKESWEISLARIHPKPTIMTSRACLGGRVAVPDRSAVRPRRHWVGGAAAGLG